MKIYDLDCHSEFELAPFWFEIGRVNPWVSISGISTPTIIINSRSAMYDT